MLYANIMEDVYLVLSIDSERFYNIEIVSDLVSVGIVI